MQKLPEKLDKFHFLYDEDNNVHMFILKILRYIFRSIRMKEESNNTKQIAIDLIKNMKEYIMKLILIIVKQTIAQVYPMDYLYLLKIIFKTILKNGEMFQHCTQECLNKNLKLLEFFNELFNTHRIE